MIRDGKRQVFFTAGTVNGTKIQGIAFGMKNESHMVIGMKGYKSKTDSPINMIMVFDSADDYFLGKIPVFIKLSKEAQEKARTIKCFEHMNQKIEVRNGLPDCFECREHLLIGA